MKVRSGEKKLIEFKQWIELDEEGQEVLVQQRKIIGGEVAGKDYYVNRTTDETIKLMNKMKHEIAVM